VYYHEAVVKPVLEYASPFWHISLTADQTKTLEADTANIGVTFGNEQRSAVL